MDQPHILIHHCAKFVSRIQRVSQGYAEVDASSLLQWFSAARAQSVPISGEVMKASRELELMCILLNLELMFGRARV